MGNKALHALIAVALAGAGWHGAACAQAAAPSYAIMTMLGERLTVVTYRPAVGSRQDTNHRIEVALPDDALDGVAAFAADDAIRRLQPGAKTSLYTTRDAKLLPLQEQAVDGDRLPGELLEQVKALVAKAKADRLLVLTRKRAPARIRMYDGVIGSGQLTGVGFYIDPWMRVMLRDTGQSATGFVAPYAYLKANLYDMATLRPLGAAYAIASEVKTNADSKSATVAWEAMGSDEKFEALQAVIRKAVAEAIPRTLP